MESTIPDPHTELPTHPPAPADRTAADRAGRAPRVEAHGIDHIPDEERHGRPRDLFAVWAAPNVSYLNLVVGGTLVLIGLDLWQSLAVIAAGNLLWAGVGLLAVSGPAAGAPSEVIMRAMFGVRGNRVNTAVTGWLVSVCYLALNWAAASLAAFGLAERAGLTPGTPLKVLVIVLVAAATLAISVYGHATIVRLYGPFTLVLTAVFLLLTGYLLTGGHTDWHYRPAEPLHGTALLAALAGGTALIASAPLSYSTSADFSRYLPRTASPRAVAGWTALGAFVPSVLFTALGTLAATTLDMTDPQSALTAVLPGWARPLFLLAIVLSAVANNAMTAYSSGLALQAVGLRIRRSRSVALDGALGVALTLYALLVSDFLDTVNSVLELMVALTGPVMAVYATDIVLRRNRYHGPDLTDETPASPHWYARGVNPAGAVALLLGTAAATLCLSTPVFTGWIAGALAGTDLSLPAGMLTAAAAYWLLTPRRTAG
ncbi:MULTISPECIES: cytosine permease [Kitasatospora]|uniref:Putative transporter n=1 Tax=Kitasatospora setae (strain ATCC 33774 / DSM 43861 / JCM 3304 / KCC A-0304 / NBRC 14216 / KM-6054) TaxID=452652 RepID=E4N9Y3_KITSK|nr:MULTISPECIES: cytosine permease [Kitasatospora]BAJ28014.1 putative transporter [Kitasatospora setae KM-6054]